MPGSRFHTQTNPGMDNHCGPMKDLDPQLAEMVDSSEFGFENLEEGGVADTSNVLAILHARAPVWEATISVPERISPPVLAALRFTGALPKVW